MEINKDVIKNVINMDNSVNNNSDINFKIGKNLLNIIPDKSSTTTQYGITVTINTDGTILLNGTCTTGFNAVVYRPYIDYQGCTYKSLVLSGSHSGADVTMVLSTSAGNTYYAPIQSGTPVPRNVNGEIEWMGLYVNVGAVCNNLLIEPYIFKGSNPSVYGSYLSPAIYVNGTEIYNRDNIDGRITALETFKSNTLLKTSYSKNRVTDTGVAIDGGNAGAAALILITANYSAGNSTGAGLYLLRCGFDGGNYNVTTLHEDGMITQIKPIWSKTANNHLGITCSGSGNCNVLIMLIS